MRIQKKWCQIFDKLHVHTSLTIGSFFPHQILTYAYPSVIHRGLGTATLCCKDLWECQWTRLNKANTSANIGDANEFSQIDDRSDFPISQASEKLICPLKTDGWKTIFPFEIVPFKGHDMFTMGWLHPPPTWRIILVSKWLVTMVIVSPLSRLAPLTKGLWLINGGSLTTYSRPGMTIQVGIRSPKWWSRWGIHQKFSKWTNKSSKVYAWSHL